MSTDTTEPNLETFLRQATVSQLLDAYDLGQPPDFAKSLADELQRRDLKRFNDWKGSGEDNPRRFFEAQPAPPTAPAPLEDPAVETAREVERLARDFGLNAKQTQDLAKLVEVRGLLYVRQQAALTRSKTRKNAAGFFLSALRDDYQPPKPHPKASPRRSAVQDGPEGWEKAFRDLCKERYPACNPRGWAWAALAPSIRDEIQEWMRDRQEPKVELAALERLWREANDQQREAWRQDEMLRHFEPKEGEKPGLPFLSRLYLLTHGGNGQAPAAASQESSPSLEVIFRDEQGRSFCGVYREGHGMSWPEQELAPEVRAQMERMKALLGDTERRAERPESARDPAPDPGERPDVPVVKIEAEGPERARVLVNGRELGAFEGPNASVDAQRCVAAWLVAELDRDGGLGLTRAALHSRWQAEWQKENARLRSLVDAALAAKPHELVAWRESARKALQPPAPPAPWVLTPQERNVIIEALRGRRGPQAAALLKRLLPAAPEQEPALGRFSKSGHEQELWRRAEARHGLKETWTAEFRSRVQAQIGRMMERAETAAKAGLNPDVEEEVYRYRRNLTRELEQNLKGATDDERRRAADRLEIMVQGKRRALMEGRGQQHPEEGDVVPSLQPTHTRNVKR